MEVKKEVFSSEFVERLKNKDKEAWESLLKEFGPNLLNFGKKMCKDNEDAMDVFQDTIESAYNSIRKLKKVESLKQWLFKVAANACLMKKRSQSLKMIDELYEDEMEESGEIGERYQERKPEELYEERELKEIVKKAILKIPENYRIVLLLREIEGFSTEETAKILNISNEAVKMRLSRARNKLKEEVLSIYR